MVESVDLPSPINTISFVSSNSMMRTVTAKNLEVQAFIRTLKVGDEVAIVYEEVLAQSNA